ncbi:MAG: hypothetical protein DRQ48_00225 [Gammaproteobacteria bacterium]|nr:MAG: hypothetical protein DRQ48_00225 [Gammaproteobacteria bacterium]
MSLEKLSTLAQDQWEAEKRVRIKEQELKDAKKAERKISEELIPDLMDELGIEEFTTSAGIAVSVKENIRASISKDNAPAAFTWLRKNGHAGLIKRAITVIAKNDEQGTEIMGQLDDYDVSDKAAVHAGTLSAWVREKLAAGEDIPMDLLGVFRQRISKVKV